MTVAATDRRERAPNAYAQVTRQKVDDLEQVVARLDLKINALLGLVVSALLVEVLRLAAGRA